MFGSMKEEIKKNLEALREQGLYKKERVLESKQGSRIYTAADESAEKSTQDEIHQDVSRQEAGTQEVLNFCSNNYLGLAADPEVIEAAGESMEKWGYGLSSVRFICGTQELHKDLEKRISSFLGTEDALLYAACFDANAGVFEPLLGREDAIISDALNHASIIDGVRLCKAERYRYTHSDMQDLERCLKEAQGARYRMICTDGVFSMDGDIARLKDICDLADAYDALVMVDDSHATGYIGETGRGTPEYWGVQDRVDIITTTFGKALGGASGGCTAGRREIIELLRQRSRPYLFSNTLAPAVAGGSLKVLDILERDKSKRKTLLERTAFFKQGIESLGFDIVKGETAIIPIMLYEEKLAGTMADQLLAKGIYVIGFSYPVVPKGQARIRVQISAAHTLEDVKKALAAFEEIGRSLGVIS
ncbi:MAG: glycine C-acetyltransferase [Spirochaetia bacterium]|nr:glycine C-acetyltransferase [Spirochaetia bacterium]